MDSGDQGRPGGHLELPRLRRRTGRDHPAGQPGRLAADKGEGKKIEWDAVNLKATNAPELDFLIHPKYRSPYSVAPYST